MRILLQENTLTKKTLEQRLKKLTSAFTEIQHDLAGKWVSPQTVYPMKIQFHFPRRNDNLYKDFKKYNLRRLSVQR